MGKRYLDAPVRTVKDRIIRYKTVGDIVLTAEEERVLLRLEYADMLMRTHHSYCEVRDALEEKFGVSRFTADKDFGMTQEIFARSRAINKKYEGGIHLDRINRMIKHYESMLLEKDKDGFKKLGSKEQAQIGAILTKLYDNYTYQLNSIPSENPVGKIVVPSMIFQLVQNNYTPPMSPEQAMEEASNYINYEMTDNGNEGDSQSGDAFAALDDSDSEG